MPTTESSQSRVLPVWAQRATPRLLRLLLLTVLSALLYASTFPPISAAPLMWIALVPWLRACMLAPPRRAAGLGAVFGILAAYGVGWWFPAMLAEYFELSAVFGWVGFFAVSLGLAGSYFAAFAAWVSWLAARRLAGPLTIAAGWVTCEYARGTALIGNPWALSAYSQIDMVDIAQIADVAGPYGVSALVGLVNGFLASLWTPASDHSPRWRSALFVIAVVASAVLYGQHRLDQDFTVLESRPLHVKLIQGAIEREHSWHPEYRSVGLERYLSLSESSNESRPDVVVWPEQAVSFYPQEASGERRLLLTKAGTLGGDLVLGAPHYEFHDEQTRYHNSVFLIRDGTLQGRYDKQALVPLAEQPLLGRLGDSRVSYSPGDGPRVFDTRAGRIGPFLCFEAMYPSLVSAFTAAGAEVLANLSNDAWFGAASPAALHLEMARMRAIESRRFLLRATSTGYSAIIDPYGRIAAKSGFGTAEVLSGSVRISRARTFYVAHGDAFAWSMIALAAASAVRRRRA